MWKDFFYYTKGERRGIIALLVLICLFVILRALIPGFLCPNSTQPLPQEHIAKLHELQQQISQHTAKRPLTGKIDPLQLDSSGFVKVGFTADEAHEIITLKRNNTREDFYFLFMEYAFEKNIDWVDHLDDLRVRE